MQVSKMFFLMVIWLTSGCSTYLYSPPARVSPLESPGLLEKGASSAEIQTSVNGAIFGPDLVKIGAQVSQGISDEVEVGGEFNMMSLGRDDHAEHNIAEDHHPNIYTARLSAKWSPEIVENYLAFTAGLGGGLSAAGGFVSPDVGVVMGYKNPYVTPFVSSAVYVSQPVDPIALDMRKHDEVDPDIRQPKFTHGYSVASGATLHLKQVDLTPGFSIDFLDDSNQSTAFIGLHFGFRANFD